MTRLLTSLQHLVCEHPYRVSITTLAEEHEHWLCCNSDCRAEWVVRERRWQ